MLDLMMPGMKGTEVCRQIKQTPGLDRVRVIAMSGYLTAENEAQLLAAGAECCIAKPVDGAALLKMIGWRTTGQHRHDARRAVRRADQTGRNNRRMKAP